MGNIIYLATVATALALSTSVIYFLAKYEPEYFELYIAAISAVYIYSVTTLYAVIKGVSAQKISIAFSIFGFAIIYLFAKRELSSDIEGEEKRNP